MDSFRSVSGLVSINVDLKSCQQRRQEFGCLFGPLGGPGEVPGGVSGGSRGWREGLPGVFGETLRVHGCPGRVLGGQDGSKIALVIQLGANLRPTLANLGPTWG